MGKYIGITPTSARLAVIRSGGSLRGAARILGCSDSTIRWHLARAPMLTVTVTVDGDDSGAILDAIRAALAPSGVTLTSRP